MPSPWCEFIPTTSVVATWPFADVRRADGRKALRLMCTSAPPLARHEIADADAAAQVASHFPQLEAGRAGAQTGRIVVWSLAAAVSIVLVTIFGIPLIADRLAPLVPYAVEKRIGEAVEDFPVSAHERSVCLDVANWSVEDTLAVRLIVDYAMTPKTSELTASTPGAASL